MEYEFNLDHWHYKLLDVLIHIRTIGGFPENYIEATLGLPNLRMKK